MERLADANIAHLRIEPDDCRPDATATVGLRRLRGATVSPSADQLATDRAQLLATTAVQSSGRSGRWRRRSRVGTDGIAAHAAVPAGGGGRGALRKATEDRRRSRSTNCARTAAEAVGVEPPHAREAAARHLGQRRPERAAGARRDRRSLVPRRRRLRRAAPSLVQDAAWGWIAAGSSSPRLPRLTQANATLGSVPQTLPFGPVYAMQLATGYMNLALPSSLARMAINIRFFQRQGVPPAAAVASGAMDSLAGTVLQALLLVLLLIFSQAALGSICLRRAVRAASTSRCCSSVVGVSWSRRPVACRGRARVRSVITGRVRHGGRRSARRSPGCARRRSSWQLLVGNVATELLFATALGMIAIGLGYDISLVDLLVINLERLAVRELHPGPGRHRRRSRSGSRSASRRPACTEEAALATALLYRIAPSTCRRSGACSPCAGCTRNSYL